jgi:hypothetical protein
MMRDNHFRVNIDIIYYTLWSISLFLAGLGLLVQSRGGPDNDKVFDEWIWKQGRKTFIYAFLAFLIQAINQTLPAQNNFFGQYRVFILIGYLAFAIFSGSILIIYWKPKLVLSGSLTGIGSSAMLFYLGFIPARIIAILQPDPMYFWISIVFPVIVPLIFLIRRQIDPKTLNPVQFAVINTIHPDRLFTALRTYNQVLEDQFEALKVKFRLEKDLPLGVKTELIKLYAEQGKTENEIQWWITVIAGLVALMTGAIGEAFFQDLLYDPLIKPFLCTIISNFCN